MLGSTAKLPLVGRADDLTRLRADLARSKAGRVSFVLLAGEGGVGKTRLLTTLIEEAKHSGWAAASGRAYPLDVGTPYALFSDAFVPLLRAMDPARLAVIARGSQGRLARLFPGLGAAEGDRAGPADRAELFWSFAEVVKGLAERTPLLLTLDDLHWADQSSLELLHFLMRQLGPQKIAIIGTVNDAELDRAPKLLAAIHSLVSLGVLDRRTLTPLTRENTDELIREAFGVTERVTRDFAARLHAWTGGNPFFIEEALKALVESGRLRSQGGSWVGWDLSDPELPSSVRDAVRLRIALLSPPARQVAEVVALVGRASYDVIQDVCGLADADLVAALEELRSSHGLDEGGTPRDPVYQSRHPMVAQTLHADIGLARRRLLHGRIAVALEKRYGDRDLLHADEIARHFARGGGGELSLRAARYLALAGRAALVRFGDREAVEYLSAALERLEQGVGSEGGAADEQARVQLLVDLGRARQRLGEFDAAIALWTQAREICQKLGDQNGVASAHRRIGLAYFRSGRHAEALAACERALASASADAWALRTETRLMRGACLQALGRLKDARSALEVALEDATSAADPSLEARCHRALLIFHTLAGPPGVARAHGARAVELAEASGDQALACSSHWAMAVLEGLTGHSPECDFHTRESERLADVLGSPLLRLASDEVQVEHAFGRGDWDTGLAIGERAITLARAFNQRSLLPRLLVWTGLIYLGRDEILQARKYFDEAWSMAGVEDPERATDVHSVVPAHIGLANYYMTIGEWDEAIDLGKRALDIVDRTGYRAWAVHRLLPIISEAHLFKRDVDAAHITLSRLRADAEELGHPLGLAWADAGFAIIEYMIGDMRVSIGRLEECAQKLERIPFLPDAARVRRQIAGRMKDIGDRDGAIRELRRVHDIFLKLGAQRELEKTRIQFHELGARPPAKSAGIGAGSLTEREVEIVRLVAEHKSNKAIGKTLGISPRTVGTHLSNIYGKLDVASRAELAVAAPVILSVGM